MTSLSCITDARLVDATGQREGTLNFAGDRISLEPAKGDVFNAKGAYVAPGIVDLGVFAVDKPAFIAGGITRIALMPDASPPLDNPGLVQRSALAAKPDLWVHPLGAATRGLAGRELTEYALMAKAGAKAIATGRQWIADSGVMHRVLTYAASLGLTVIVHAEDGGLTGNAVATAGETATRHGLSAAPAIAEAMAITRDLALADVTGAALHFRQVTTEIGFHLIRAAKDKGLRVTCGISPAHLMLSDIAVTGFRTFAKLSPPLRCENDRLAAIEAVRDGTIDVLCSAHDPRGPEAKRLPFADAAPGMAGAETLLPLGLGLVRDGVIDLPRLMAMLSTNPAAIIGVEGGSLAVGSAADLMIFNPETPWRISGESFAAAASNTPFEGLPTQGRVLKTIKGGRLLGI